MHPSRSQDAVAAVHADLDGLARKRARAFLILAIGSAAFIVLMSLLPASPGSGPRDMSWWASLALLFASALLAASAALGVPLWQRGAMIVVVCAAVIAALAGTLMIVQPLHSGDVGFRVTCLVHGGAIGIAVFFALRMLLGRLWRRFPDGAAIASIGATTAGLAYLAARCGVTDPVHLVASHVPVLLLVFAITRVVVVLRSSP